MNYPLMRNNILREDLDAVIAHLQQDDPKLTNGPEAKAFETEWSNWLDVQYSVFVNSGASANLLTMAILKHFHPDGGEVIVPSLTWISDIASVIQNGFTPIFIDVDMSTLGMNSSAIMNAVTDRTRAVFLTHVQGFNALTDELISFLSERKIPLIEDVCESHGATHIDKKCGSIGWISNFSFYYAHHMSTIEGGMICTNDPTVYEIARMLRSHGMVREASSYDIRQDYIKQNPELNPDFIFAYSAYNVRNTEIGGIIGRSQLKRLDKNISKRTDNLHYFLDQINKVNFYTDFKLIGSSNYAFNLILNNPDHAYAHRLMTIMRENNIEFRRGSAGGGNQLRQPYLSKHVEKDFYKKFPITDHIHFFGFYIGNFPDLEQDDISNICKIINSI